MSRIAYVNGHYQPLASAAVHIEDRGFQFSDGVYEVVFIQDGRPVDQELHLARLARSLRELRITPPMSDLALRAVMAEVTRRNRLRSGLLYIQVTRGSAPRNHVFPPPGTPPSLVITLRRAAPMPASIEAWQCDAITVPDQRWARRDIKSVSLLPNVLARQAAKEAGALEAIMYDADFMVTEGASTSVFIVDANGTLRTRPLSHAILPGCTRAALIGDLVADGLLISETSFTLDELRAAREVFITAATTFVKPVLHLDGAPVGDGTPGPVSRALFTRMHRHVTGARHNG
jgi:D-alanine transaminase